MQIQFADGFILCKGNAIPYKTEIQDVNTEQYFHSPDMINTLETCGQDILNQLDLNDLNVEERDTILVTLNKYKKLFFREGDKLTFTTKIEHNIPTSVDGPIYSKIYRYPHTHEQEIKKQIEEMLNQGIIEDSNSPYNAHFG